MDVDAQSPLGSVATFAGALTVAGCGRGGKPKDEDLKGAALAAQAGGTRSKG